MKRELKSLAKWKSDKLIVVFWKLMKAFSKHTKAFNFQHQFTKEHFECSPRSRVNSHKCLLLELQLYHFRHLPFSPSPLHSTSYNFTFRRNTRSKHSWLWTKAKISSMLFTTTTETWLKLLARKEQTFKLHRRFEKVPKSLQLPSPQIFPFYFNIFIKTLPGKTQVARQEDEINSSRFALITVKYLRSDEKFAREIKNQRSPSPPSVARGSLWLEREWWDFRVQSLSQGERGNCIN